MTNALQVVDLRCEWARDPIGIGAARPRLSWRVDAPESTRGARQTAYQIQVTSEGTTGWDSGRVESTRVGVVYAGEPLVSRQRCEWRVRVWDGSDEPSEWGPTAFWETGLLDSADWRAEWIGSADDGNAKDRPCPLFRHEFEVSTGLDRARLYITAHGTYHVEVNGRRVSEDLFRPGWTAYRRRVQYQTYDVGELLEPGPNAIGVILADGWWRGEVTGGRVRNWYGNQLGLLAQIELTYEDGRRSVESTSSAWRWRTGPYAMADLFRGETYDARGQIEGWSRPGHDARAWHPVVIEDSGYGELVAQHGPSVRPQGEVRPVALLHTPSGRAVLDMGQNMVGWVRFRVKGPAGATVTLRHGETLDESGEFTVDHLVLPVIGRPMQEVRYTLRGDPQGETFEPRFATQGFRYVALEGWPGEPSVNDFTGILVSSDARAAGSFECSDPRLNRLQENIVRTQLGNFVEVPTDCPTRERSGWTGDLQAFAATAVFNREVTAVLERWLADLAADQQVDGKVPDTIPWVRAMAFLGTGTGSTGWGDAATIVPSLLYRLTGDESVLERQFDSMVRWVRYLEWRASHRPRRWPVLRDGLADGHRRYIVDSGFHWGDHYPPTHESVVGVGRHLFRVPRLIATAFFAHSAKLVAEAARVLGRPDDADRYGRLRARIEHAFRVEFVDADGRLWPDDQCSYALALAFDLLTPDQRPRAVQNLVDAVRRAQNHVTTGFLGTPHLLPVLADGGREDVAFDLLVQTSPPSWLDAVARGATTIWERFRAITPEGKVRFASLNHFAFGSVGDFLYRYVAGLDISRVGLGELVIHPRPGGGLSRASAAFDSVFGPCKSAWQATATRFELRAVVPPGVTAKVVLPGAHSDNVTESGRPVRGRNGISGITAKPGAVVVQAGSGHYSFAFPLEKHPGVDRGAVPSHVAAPSGVEQE